MPQIHVDGVKLNYRQVGAGADVVLVHGLGANQAFWNLALVNALARDYRVTTFDLRGHGYSDLPPTGYRPADVADDLRGLLNHLDIAQAHLVGHSYGGLVVLRYALAEPEHVQSLTVADTRLRSLQPRQGVTAQADWPAVKAALAEHGVVLDEDDPYIGLCLFEALAAVRSDKVTQALAEPNGYVPFGRGNTRSAQRWLQLVRTTTLESDYRAGADIAPAELARLRMPVLAIYGEESPTRQTGDNLGRVLADCRTVLVPGARHFHLATHADFFRDTLLAFLRTLSQPR